jgi:hypothetical protein
MGEKVLCNKEGSGEWLPATVLGVHPDSLFDVLYEDGQGEMQVKAENLMPGMGDGDDKENAAAAASAPPKKKSGIGWNASAFADEGGEPAVDEEDAASAPAPQAKAPSSPAPVPAAAWTPSVGDKVETKDFATKEWATAKVVGLDVELGTVDLKYESGEVGKGIPKGLIRERQRRKSRRDKDKAKAAAAAASSSSAAPAPAPASSPEVQAKIDEVGRLMRGMNVEQADAALKMVQALKSVCA